MSEIVEVGLVEADEFLVVVLNEWRLLLMGSLAVGIVALGLTFLITPSFTARTSFLPPQQPQSGAASALTSLGGLSSLFGAAIVGRTPADQFVSLLESTTAADRVIDRFGLMKVYDKQLRVDARKQLAKNTRVTAGKKDGIIAIEVDDESPARAAAIANYYVDELRALTNQLSLTEAKQRRVFFEAQLERTRVRLMQAQQALQTSGFDLQAMKAEPKAAAESYARVKAEVTSAEARLNSLRQSFTTSAPEVQQAEATIAVLYGQLARIENSVSQRDAPDYVGKYREFKYEEALFEQFSRQYELARLDESREGLLQVIDFAQPPERKSWPKRALLAATATVAGFIALLVWVLGRHRWDRIGSRQERLRAALRQR